MAETNELLRSKHGFGALENIDTAIASGKLDAYDVLFVKDANGKPYVGWVDKDGNKVIVEETKEVIVAGESLPESGEEGKIYVFGEDGYIWNGEEFINLSKPVDLSSLEDEISKKANSEDVVNQINQAKTDSNAYTDEKVAEMVNGIDAKIEEKIEERISEVESSYEVVEF